IYRVPVVGGDARKVVGPGDEADWSPDGREIAFTRNETKNGRFVTSLFRAAVDGSSERLIAEGRNHILLHPRGCPDGRTEAALQTSGTGTQLPEVMVFPLDGSAPRSVRATEAPTSGIGFGSSWNGDSRGVLLLGGGYIDATSPIGSRTRQILLRDLSGKTRSLFSSIDLRSFDVLGPGSLVVSVGGPRSNLREVSTAKGEAGRWLTRGSCVD